VKKIILSLCDYSGRWPSFYTGEDGYDVRLFDIKHGKDIRLLEKFNEPIHGILAAPPCTAFAGSGAQYWKAKDADGRTAEGLALIDACLRIIHVHNPRWWALENPVGRLKRYLGPPRFMFDPYEYAGYLGPDEEINDRYTKKTLLWGSFSYPVKDPRDPIKACAQGSWLQKLGGASERTKELRSMTPLGFARAFREANP
jgi:hypothetical protein